MASILLYKYVLIQLLVMILITMIAAIYVLHYQPFDVPLLNNLEVMNEAFTLLLINVIFCFTKIIEDEATQYMIGFVFVGLMCFCIFVHLVFLFKDITQNLLLKTKVYYAKRKAKN